MPPVNVLIKPASGLCDLRCGYCFYRDVSAHRETASYGVMTEETLELVVRRIFAYAEGECTIAWQGGEPTLAGLDFFRRYIELEHRYNVRGLPVHRALQTNGYRLGEAWAAFLAEHHFLTGVSLDGVRATHDAWRRTPEGGGSFSEVFATCRLFDRFRVDYNLLVVVTHQTAEKIGRIYPFFQEHGFRYQQYIACLDPLGEARGGQPWSLTPEAYGRFLIRLFDLWYPDCLRGRAPYIRQFENYIGLLLGVQPESCEQRGTCAVQTVVEADGSVYPCDFFVTDEYRMGNLRTQTLAEIRSSPVGEAFFQRSVPLPEECRRCPYLQLCRGGCFRHRIGPDGSAGQNYFCQSYRMFFDRCLPRLEHLAQAVRRGR